jgi:hypothetical protein
VKKAGGGKGRGKRQQQKQGGNGNESDPDYVPSAPGAKKKRGTAQKNGNLNILFYITFHFLKQISINQSSIPFRIAFLQLPPIFHLRRRLCVFLYFII